MDWFLFLKYFLIAVCSTLAVWFTIKIGFRGSTEIEEGAPESEVLPGDDSQKDSLRCLSLHAQASGLFFECVPLMPVRDKMYQYHTDLLTTGTVVLIHALPSWAVGVVF